jgi:hypothetical protein
VLVMVQLASSPAESVIEPSAAQLPVIAPA